MKKYSTRDKIVEILNRLFVYTDQQEWTKLQQEIFIENVQFDMSALGGKNSLLTSKEICETWRIGFIGIDAINHLAGNYMIDIEEDAADVFAYATATHYKASATAGKTREFVGTYDIHLIKGEEGWRIDKFKYNLKYSGGNVDLK